MWWTEPLWLLVLVIIIPFLRHGWILDFYSWHKKEPAFKEKSSARNLLRRLTWLRVAAIISIILALAGTTIIFPSTKKEIVALIDVSDSIGTVQVEETRRKLLQVIQHLKSSDKVGIIAFAGQPRLVTPLTTPGNASMILESASLELPQTMQTDLQAALRVGINLLRQSNGNQSILLFSDGRSNKGGSVNPLFAKVTKIPIYTIPVGISGIGVKTEGFLLPVMVHPNEASLIQWKVNTTRPQNIKALLKINDRNFKEISLKLPEGNSTVPIPFSIQTPGIHQVDLKVFTEQGQPIAAANFSGVIRVDGPARILLIRNQSYNSPLADTLQIQGMSVQNQRAEELPENIESLSSYAAVILDNIPATEFTAKQQEAIKNYVSGGGGLLVIGGDSSLGRGEYYATPLEDILPVKTDTRQRLFFNRASILFVIDHSGSMSEMVGKTSKQLAAMQGVAAAIKELNPQDEVGILSFDMKPTWVVPFTPAANRQQIISSLAKVGEGGGTDMATAFQEVIRGFGPPGPVRRHMVVLTDGQTNIGDFQSLCRKLRSIGVSITSIGVGEEINEELLRDISRWGNGKYYRANLAEIPQVIRKETVRVTRDLIQEGKFNPIIATEAALLEGLNQPSLPVKGYLITKPKKLATVYLEVGKKDPLLAAWRYGNGKVAVFTSDSGYRWFSSWLGTESYNRIWGQLLRFIERSTVDAGLKVETRVEASTIRVVVEALSQDRRFRTGLHLTGRTDGVSGQSFILNETAPGHYETVLPLIETGLQFIEVFDEQGNWASGWAWNPPGDELQLLGPDMPTLGQLSSITGGRVLSIKRLMLPKSKWAWESVSLRYFFILAALAFFLGELFLRSTSFGQLSMFQAVMAAWWRAQRRIMEMIEGPENKEILTTSTRYDQQQTIQAHRYLAERSRHKL